ncbi:MAG: response regulator [Oscillospiraceae bacterium]|nr:response regulator [Oscillospiraceae bacterium]
MKNLKILLIEDETAECKAISKCIESISEIQLVGVTNNIDKALEYVTDYLPDAIILEIELHKGKGNGITFMEKLHSMETEIKPYVLVTTYNTNEITYAKLRELGVGFIFSKHQNDYSAGGVISFLLSMKNAIMSQRDKADTVSEVLFLNDREEKIKKIIKRINMEFDLIGINPKVLGRIYLTEGILIAMTKTRVQLSNEIAKKFEKSVPSVERAMQNAVNTAWKVSPIKDLAQHYTARIRSEKGYPTVTEFVFYYAEKIKSDF